MFDYGLLESCKVHHREGADIEFTHKETEEHANKNVKTHLLVMFTSIWRIGDQLLGEMIIQLYPGLCRHSIQVDISVSTLFWGQFIKAAFCPSNVYALWLGQCNFPPKT